MGVDQKVWKGAMIVSIFLVLFSLNVSAWGTTDMDAKMDSMKSEMDATFAAKFGPSQTDSGSSDTAPDTNNDNDSDTDRNSDTSDDSDDFDQDIDDMKRHISAKFTFFGSSSDPANPDETDGSDDDSTSNDDSNTGWESPSDDSSDSNEDNSDSDSNTPTPTSLEEETEQALHDLINDERRQRGLQPFNWDSGLAETADYKSDDMADRGYFSHYDPEGDNFRDIYNQFGYSCRISSGGRIYLGGENIARTWFDRDVRADHGGIVHYDDAQELANGLRRQWMTSDGHRRAILRPYYESHGLGVEITSSGRVYATEHFC